MKKLLFILSLLVSFLAIGQNTIDYTYNDFLGTNGEQGYITVNQKGDDIKLVNIDSLKALKMMYNFLLDEQRGRNELSYSYKDALQSIKKCVDLLNHIPIPMSQIKRYKVYIEATKKQGYREIKSKK